jgi:hypothetical protein
MAIETRDAIGLENHGSARRQRYADDVCTRNNDTLEGPRPVLHASEHGLL